MTNTNASTFPKERYSKEKVTATTEATMRADSLNEVESPRFEKITPNKESDLNQSTERKEVELFGFLLNQVTPEELLEFRKNNVSSLVLKIDDKLYHSEIPRNMSFTSERIGPHMCAIPGHTCHRLSAYPDEKGGCAKVRAYSNFIERYPWITHGYETFNTEQDSFVVLSCSHYEPCPPRHCYSAKEFRSRVVNLELFMYKNLCSNEF